MKRIIIILAILAAVATLALLVATIVGCTTVNYSVTVYGGTNGAPVSITGTIDQTSTKNIPVSVLTGLDTNAWKAIAQGAAAGAK